LCEAPEGPFRQIGPDPFSTPGKEPLPWWNFALFGGLATVWLLTPTLWMVSATLEASS
jgi:hypothetical protein